MRSALRFSTAILIALATSTLLAQRGGGMTPEQTARRWDIEKQLQSIAVVERKVMMPMRDGVRLATDIYRPKDASAKVPIIWVRTPYNFNFWDVRNGVPSDMTAALTAVKHGYAYVVQNERGHFFSEGQLRHPRRADHRRRRRPVVDGEAALVERQGRHDRLFVHGRIPDGHRRARQPGYAAMNVQGFGAGVGRVGPYYEQGNWYRGGAVQMLFITGSTASRTRCARCSRRARRGRISFAASRLFDLAQHMPPVDWSKALWHLPEQDILTSVDGPRGIFADPMPVATGGRMIQRAPNDPAWYKGGLCHDNMPLNVPGLWFMSWYDVSVGPNLALYNHVRKTATGDVANQQWAVIAPVTHCGYTRATENTMVGERNMGDARLDYAELIYGFFDRFLKGEDSRAPRPASRRCTTTRWASTSGRRPTRGRRRGATPVTFYLASGGHANTLNGDGGWPPRRRRPTRPTASPTTP